MLKLKAALLIAVILALFSSGAATVEPTGPIAQQPTASLLQHITIGVARRPCDPAQVKSFALGKQPLEAVLAQVEVRSNSEKPIASIKLGWRIYAGDSSKAQFESCDSEPTEKVLASGWTQPIPLVQLEPKAIVTIGINPLPVVLGYENQTIIVDRPFVTLEDLRPLAVDGKLVPPGKYALLMFVSEAHYLDGTAWTSPLR